MSDNAYWSEAQTESRPAAAERRAVSRHSADLEAACRPASDEAATPWKAIVRDVSTLGIGLTLPCAAAEGVLLAIDLEGRPASDSKSMLARVIHVERESEGSWQVGCAFVRELDNAQLSAFQAQRLKSQARGSRRWVRFPCNVETVCYTCETVPGERRPGKILNISAGGVGLLLPCQFSPGTLLQLELPAEAARLALIRVVRTVEEPSRGWFLGCEFVDQLGAQELKDLLGLER